MLSRVDPAAGFFPATADLSALDCRDDAMEANNFEALASIVEGRMSDVPADACQFFRFHLALEPTDVPQLFADVPEDHTVAVVLLHWKDCECDHSVGLGKRIQE